jgi:hypothetical protein
MGAVALAGVLAVSPRSFAQSHPEFVSLDRMAAALYRPDTGPAPHVGIIYQNGSPSISAPMCGELAQRGFLVLCSAESSASFQDAWENVALDVKKDIEFMRKQPGIKAVVLYAHSGGGTVLSFYQAVAENGAAFCKDPKKLWHCTDAWENLPPADAVVLPDAHPGLSIMPLRSINPAYAAENGRMRVVPDLDALNPSNGYNPNGTSKYSKEFETRYFEAQAKVMNNAIDRALSLQALIRAGEPIDPTIDVITLPSQPGRLEQLDPDLPDLTQTSKPRKLLKNDGSIITTVVKNMRAPVNPSAPAAPQVGITVTQYNSARFLSRSAIRAHNARDGIDYCSSNASAMCNVQYIRVPVLFLAMEASSFIADMERMYESSPSKDKDFLVVEGATHTGVPCTACEKTPGQYGNSQKNMYGFIRNWINKRF